MDFSTVLGLLARHGLTSLAGVLVTHGLLGSSGTEQFVGAGMLLLGVFWSIYQKYGQAKVHALLAGKGVKAVVFALAVLGASSYVPDGTEWPVGKAFASDLPPPVVRKAPPLTPAGYPVGCGLFWGMNTQGAGGAVSGAPVGTNILNADVGLLAGYTCPLASDGSMGWFVEADFNWTNLNGNTNGFALTGPVHFEQRFAVFGGIDKILSVFPKVLNLPAFPSTPLLPAGVTAGPAAMYLFGSVHEQDVSASFGLDKNKDWLISPGVGLGTLTRWSNGLVIDVWAEMQFKSSGVFVGPLKAATGDMVRVGLAAKY